jgi:hypothetical protein
MNTSIALEDELGVQVFDHFGKKNREAGEILLEHCKKMFANLKCATMVGFYLFRFTFIFSYVLVSPRNG